MAQQWSGGLAVSPGAGSGWRKTAGGSKLTELFRRIRTSGVTREQLVFLCIGTDRSSGDAFGPLTGTLLQEAGFAHVVGTLDRPCDGDTWGERILELEALLAAPGSKLVAVDACRGLLHRRYCLREQGASLHRPANSTLGKGAAYGAPGGPGGAGNFPGGGVIRPGDKHICGIM
jgi:hypothetical protein